MLQFYPPTPSGMQPPSSGAAAFGIGSYWSASNREEEDRAARAKAAAARIAAMTPEQKKAEADAKARQDAERKRADAAVQRAAVGARLLKKAMNNPDAFKLESALG